MKKKHLSLSRFQTMPRNALSSFKGGNSEEDNIIYIDGKPYRIKTNNDGTTVLIPVDII